MAATAVRRAPYKDFLQPALHRRFTSTATVLLAVSYVEAALLGPWNSLLWTIFPISATGARTLFVFAAGLAILILRIAQYHVGRRSSGSGWQTLRTSLTRFATYETAFWYMFSSGAVCQTYLWSMSDTLALRWITYFSGDRARLNERPLYLSCYLAVCALIQTVQHFQFDLDRLDLRISNQSGEKQRNSGSEASSQIILKRIPAVFIQSAVHAAIALPITHIAYYFIFRSMLWGWVLMFLRPFYNLSKSNIMPPFSAFDGFLLVRCIYVGTLVFFMWAVANIAFSSFMVQEPLKHGKPLTSEAKDPNGSLLNGLKSPKMPVKSFAMWELALIAQNFDVRRQAIFDDIDRKGGPMWSQVYAICMDAIKSIETRVDEYGKPAAPAPPVQEVEEPHRRVSAPLRDDPIFTTKSRGGGAWKSLEHGAVKSLEQVARAPGAPPASKLSPVVQKTWLEAKDRMLSKEQQEAMRPEHIKGQMEQFGLVLMQFDIFSSLLRQEFRDEFAGTVLGGPYAEPSLYAHAAIALSELAACSLKEDKFGNVHRDVPSIIRTFTSVIKKVEALRLEYPLHWSDTTGKRDSPAVDDVLDVMRTGLQQVVDKFEPYSSDLRLTSSDIRFAREAMVKPVVPEPEPEAEPERETKVQEKPRPRAQEKVQRRAPRQQMRTVEMEEIR
ncbi:nucleoporin protein Ndc1-Nup [Stachybotrys elegans]|uniref:Nucleoporin protein Ndc1-Nup n=1 Tax=Stachybotrys elegans TaxID=80388 RepID=A0A8K0WSV1_9HYPO|nr:nucleoporin protein Ndc1-Nup [Stachybotrys elegans]